MTDEEMVVGLMYIAEQLEREGWPDTPREIRDACFRIASIMAENERLKKGAADGGRQDEQTT